MPVLRHAFSLPRLDVRLSGFGKAAILISMSTAEIIAALPRLNPAELAQVQAKLDEIAGERWHDQADLTEADQSALNAALVEYQKGIEAGDPWDQVKARIQAKLGS